MKKLCWVLLMILPALLILGQGFLVGDMLPDAPELAYRGTHSVGVRTLTGVNKDQLNILAYGENNTNPRYDRHLMWEVWYPAIIGEGRKEGTWYMDERFPTEAVVYQGRALRDAAPVEGPFPLIVVSHGYPGTRLMLSYLTENLASKGYVVIAIDHTESTVRDQAGFASTLLNRPLDILFTIDEMDRLSKTPDHFLYGIVDADHVGLVGYSMGGYGIINAAGAGFSQAGVNLAWGVPGGHLSVRQSGNPAFEASQDPRIKAIFALAPWGGALFWDAESMKGLTVPAFFAVGREDDVSGYEQGVKLFFDRAIQSDRYLLVFDNARHNISPNFYTPDPLASTEMTAANYMRYSEPAWDGRRLNNIIQHFATAFFGIHVKGLDYGSYLDLVEHSNKGVWAQNQDGSFQPNHTHWKGFANRTALGMHLFHQEAE